MKKVILILLVTFLFYNNEANAQSSEKPKYNLSFIRAVCNDTVDKNDVLAIFAVTPIKEEDFPPVLSMRITYKVGKNGVENTVDILKSEGRKVRLVIFGQNVQEKDERIYRLIKDKIDLSKEKDMRILVFLFEDISEMKVDKMSIKYGLWEKKDQNVRIEETFDFEIEN